MLCFGMMGSWSQIHTSAAVVSLSTVFLGCLIVSHISVDVTDSFINYLY